MLKKTKKKPLTARQNASKAKKAAENKLGLELAALWRLIVFTRAERKCEICGKQFERGDFQLQAHHAVKRSQSRRLLIDPANGIALCAGHHQWADRDNFGCIAKVAPNRREGWTEYLLAERRNLTGRRTTDEEARILVCHAALYGIGDDVIYKDYPHVAKLVENA